MNEVEKFKRLIEIYEKQNPVKFEQKKDRLKAKLEFIEQGGDPKQFNFTNWQRAEEAVQAQEPKAENVCEECGFEAKSGAGLATHKRSH